MLPAGCDGMHLKGVECLQAMPRCAVDHMDEGRFVVLIWGSYGVYVYRCALGDLPFFEGRRPGLRPGGRLTFFASPKKVSKKRRPDVHALLRRVRCAAQLGRGLAKLAALKQTRDLFPPKSALLVVPDGREGEHGCCCAAAPCCFNWRARLLRSAGARRRSAQHIKQLPTNAAGCTGTADFAIALASPPAPAFPVGQGRAAE